MSITDVDLTPGITVGTASVDNEFIANGREWALQGIVTIASAARDAGNTTVTKLRKGLVLGRVTSGGKYKEYDNNDTDGTEVARAILDQNVNLLDADSVARDVIARVVFDSAVLIHTDRTYNAVAQGGDANANIGVSAMADFDNFKFTAQQ